MYFIDDFLEKWICAHVDVVWRPVDAVAADAAAAAAAAAAAGEVGKVVAVVVGIL